jgi:tripartite-type tricarboxylate transporter receptor subunit TctC
MPKLNLAAAALVAALLALAGGTTDALAQAYPAKPVRLIVPFPPGGTADILARLLGEKLSAALGQQVVAENRAGAAGGIGAAAAARAAPDGYTLFMGTTGTQTINPAVNPKLPYDPLKDFAPVSNFAASPFVLVVHPSIRAKSVRELISLANEQPGKLHYASFGSGSSAHMTGEMFRSRAGIQIVHVPYKGASPALTDLVGGHVQMMFTLLPSVMTHVRGGTLRAIAVASAQRDPSLPEVPTFIESGMPDFLADSWYGIFVPAGTPADIVARLNAEIQRVLGLADVKQRLATEGAEPMGNTPEQFAAQLKRDLAHWARVAREAKVSVE